MAARVGCVCISLVVLPKEGNGTLNHESHSLSIAHNKVPP